MGIAAVSMNYGTGYCVCNAAAGKYELYSSCKFESLKIQRLHKPPMAMHGLIRLPTREYSLVWSTGVQSSKICESLS